MIIYTNLLGKSDCFTLVRINKRYNLMQLNFTNHYLKKAFIIYSFIFTGNALRFLIKDFYKAYFERVSLKNANLKMCFIPTRTLLHMFFLQF